MNIIVPKLLKEYKKGEEEGKGGGDVELKLNYGVWYVCMYVSLHPVPSILSEKVQ